MSFYVDKWLDGAAKRLAAYSILGCLAGVAVFFVSKSSMSQIYYFLLFGAAFGVLLGRYKDRISF
jgi:hypothetical protein